jgi:hypothetical protein
VQDVFQDGLHAIPEFVELPIDLSRRFEISAVCSLVKSILALPSCDAKPHLGNGIVLVQFKPRYDLPDLFRVTWLLRFDSSKKREHQLRRACDVFFWEIELGNEPSCSVVMTYRFAWAGQWFKDVSERAFDFTDAVPNEVSGGSERSRIGHEEARILEERNCTGSYQAS